jgi:predicted dehydrogenase
MSSLIKYKVGIAGFGATGKRRFNVLMKHPSVEVVAVCEKDLKAITNLNPKINSFDNYKELLKQPLDIVFVCLPNYLAPDVTIESLERGCHVFCEKPPGRNVNDVDKVIKVENKNKSLKLMYGFNHRYHYSVRDAIKIVKSKEFGKVISLRGLYGKSKLLNFATDWRTNRKYSGGGILLDQGIHMVDLIRLFGGDFNQITSFISNNHWKHDVEDNALAIMRSKEGVIASLHSTATEWRHRFRLEIGLEKGSINLSGILSSTKSYGAEKITVAYAADDDMGDPIEKTTNYNKDNSWKDEIYDFISSIEKNKKVIYGSSNEAKKTMELVFKIYKADKSWSKNFNIK